MVNVALTCRVWGFLKGCINPVGSLQSENPAGPFVVAVVGLFNRAHFCPCKSQPCIYTMWALKLPAFPWEKESPSFCYAEALCYVATLFHVGEMPFYAPPLYTASTSHTAKTAAV